MDDGVNCIWHFTDLIFGICGRKYMEINKKGEES
jgi:hypothetical protein